MTDLAKWVWIILIAILFMGPVVFMIIGASIVVSIIAVFATGMHKKKF